MLWKKKQFWGTLIAILLLGWCLKDVRLSTVESLASRMDFLYLIPCLVCSALFVALRAVRWRILISRQKRLPMSRAVTLYAAGQVINMVMPALTGQVGRIILFARKEGLRKTFIFSTIVLEVLFDAVSLLILLMMTSLAFAFPERYRSAGIVVGAVTVAALVLLYLILQFQIKLEDWGRRRFRDKRPGLYIGLKKFIRSFTKGIQLLKSSQHLLTTMSFSFLSWLVHVLAVYLLFRTFGFGLPFMAAAVVMIINTIALMVPITPGNAGTFEVAVSTSLLAFSISRADAVLFALALHLVDLLPMFVLGFFFIHTERVNLREFKEKHAETGILDKMAEDGTYVEEEEEPA